MGDGFSRGPFGMSKIEYGGCSNEPRTEYEKLHKSWVRAIKERDDLKQRLSDESSFAAERHRKMKKQLAGADQRYAMVAAERDDLKQQLASRTEERNDLNQQLACRTEERDDVLEECSSLRGRRDEWERRRAALLEELNGVVIRRNELEEERNKALDRNTKLQEQVNRFADGHEKKVRECHDFRDVIQRLRNKVGRTREESCQSEGRLRRESKKVEADLQHKLDEARTQSERYRKSAGEANRARAAVVKHLEISRKQVRTLRKEVSRLRQTRGCGHV
jgi:chromosome segregation ATPase